MTKFAWWSEVSVNFPSRVTLKKGDFTTNTPLRQGESVTHEGWKIPNVESDEFGDAVRVEKAD